ncbi:MAG: 2-oxo-4-hydroxy-4-carboxy-5-ureidoimidazoline decarboxylase [Nocardioides sp.]
MINLRTEGAGVQIRAFNELAAADAAGLVRACADIDAWVDAVVIGRPFDDLAALTAYAERQAATWTGDEIEAALADHPRIGERHSGGGASASMSRQEQSGVGDDEDVKARLAEGNRRYEARFHRIYLVRAAGRTAEEMLAMLDDRLTNDPETELKVTGGQLAEIAVLRLKGLFT